MTKQDIGMLLDAIEVVRKELSADPLNLTVYERLTALYSCLNTQELRRELDLDRRAS